MASSALNKITKATATKGGNNIKDGNYLYFVEKLSYDERGYSGATFVAEFRVVEAASNGATDEPKKGMPGKPTIPNTVGSSCSMVCLLDKFDNAGGNVKAFLLGVLSPLGYVEDEITEELILELSGDGNPLRGLAVRNETYRGWNKGKSVVANRDMALTLNSWKPVTQTAEDIKARRAWLDANASRVEPSAAPAQTPAAATAQPTVNEQPAPTPVAQPSPATGAPSPLLSRLGVK